MRLIATAAFVGIAVAQVHAHDRTAGPAMSWWDAAAVGGLLVSGGIYAAGSARRRQRGASAGRAVRASFWGGWLAMLAAILPPLDQLASQRFAAHMLQHELLMLIGVPLLIAGQPLGTWLFGVPSALRERAASVLQRPSTRRATAVLSAPLVAWALHGLTLWIWHVPALYEWAVLNEGVHALQHAMFCLTSALFWWGLVYGRYGRAGYGAAVFYVFTTVVHTGLLGAVFTLAPAPLYPLYARRAADPLADQQLAGLVMWIPAGLILTMVGVGLFAAWMGAAERRSGWKSVER